jgi:hypothetical protein
MKILQVAAAGRARAPWIVVGPSANLHPTAVETLKKHGGEYLMINDVDQYGRFGWEGLFQVLFKEGIKSIMVEGGGLVLSELMSRRHLSIIDSVITTIVPTFLGSNGVQVTPQTEYDSNRAILQNRLRDVSWQPMGYGGDAVMCGKVEQPQQSNGILQGIVEMANADSSSEQRPPPQHHPPHQQQPGHWQGPSQRPNHHQSGPQYTNHPPHGYPHPSSGQQGAPPQGHPPPPQRHHGSPQQRSPTLRQSQPPTHQQQPASRQPPAAGSPRDQEVAPRR